LHAIAERYHLVDPAHGEQSNSLNIMRRPFLLNQHHDDGKPADMWPWSHAAMPPCRHEAMNAL